MSVAGRFLMILRSRDFWFCRGEIVIFFLYFLGFCRRNGSWGRVVGAFGIFDVKGLGVG